MFEIFSHLVSQAVASLDYVWIFFLMTLESSVFPVPSEAVMIPAGYLVASGKMNAFVAIFAGVAGSIAGASLNYFAGMYLGKPFLLKYGKYLFISSEKYAQAEKLFLKNDVLYTFLGRLIPVIRHLISLPAGVFRMKYPQFLVATTIGATIWVSILVALGYFFGQEMVTLVHTYSNEIGITAFVLLLLYIGYFLFSNTKKTK